MEIDVVMTTHNRLNYLVQTYDAFLERTRTPHVLTIIDDASEDDTPAFLQREWTAGRVDALTLLRPHRGPLHAQGMALVLTDSDPVVLCDDDVLCPDVKPDWLARLVAEMGRRPNLAMLALHHPGAKTKPYRTNGAVAYCRSLGATFCAVRRAFLEAHPFPPRPRGTVEGPMRHRCDMAAAAGLEIGYLRKTYCYHLGRESVLTGKSYGGRFIEPADWRTLEPPDEHRG